MIKPTKPTISEFRKIDDAQTSLHDPIRDRWDPGSDDGGVRLYCTQHGTRWSLQVRAQVQTKSGVRGKRFAVGTAPMSRDELKWLRDLIDQKLEED